MLMLLVAVPVANSAQHDVVPFEMCSAGLGNGSGESAANAPVLVCNKYPIGHVITHGASAGHVGISPAGTKPAGQVSATNKACSGAGTKPVGHSAAMHVVENANIKNILNRIILY